MCNKKHSCLCHLAFKLPTGQFCHKGIWTNSRIGKQETAWNKKNINWNSFQYAAGLSQKHNSTCRNGCSRLHNTPVCGVLWQNQDFQSKLLYSGKNYTGRLKCTLKRVFSNPSLKATLNIICSFLFTEEKDPLFRWLSHLFHEEDRVSRGHKTDIWGTTTSVWAKLTYFTLIFTQIL